MKNLCKSEGLLDPAVVLSTEALVNSHSEEWYSKAVAAPKESRHFVRDGARLHMLCWNWTENTDKPAVLLVHGFLAHAHWWDAVAPVLAQHYRVAALDLSGMGDSDARPDYPADWAARDILAAIDHLGIAPATVVAHSFGGSRALEASTLEPSAIRHAVVLDPYYNFIGEPAPGTGSLGGRKIYPTLAEAMKHYRLLPGAVIPPDVLQHVARHSLKPMAGGWTWKFDPVMEVQVEDDGAAILAKVAACVDYVRAENSSLVSAERAQRIVDALPNKRFGSPITFPGVDHHLLLEKPRAVADLILSLIRSEFDLAGHCGIGGSGP